MKNKKLLLNIIQVIAAFVFSCLSLKYFPLPYVWAFLAWSCIFLLQAKRSVTSFTKAFWFNIGVIFLIFTIFELALSVIDNHNKAKVRWEGGRHRRDDVLGYALRENTTGSIKKYYDDKLAYDVKVSIDKNGLRVSPPCQDCTDAIIFFGCSITYGSGVNDNETMPYVVGTHLNSKYKIYNFAVNGYGTHQMLAAIEHGLVSSIVKQNVRYVICQALYPSHIYRLAGLRDWGKSGPKYVLGKDKQPYLAGHFDDNYNKLIWIKRQLKKSMLIKKLMMLQGLSETDKDLFVAMITKSKELLHAQFHVIVWPIDVDRTDKVFEKLKNKGVNIHFIEDILPNYDKSTYKIPYDGHPTPLAHRLLAQYVVKHIIGE